MELRQTLDDGVSQFSLLFLWGIDLGAISFQTDALTPTHLWDGRTGNSLKVDFSFPKVFFTTETCPASVCFADIGIIFSWHFFNSCHENLLAEYSSPGHRVLVLGMACEVSIFIF